MGVSCVTAIEIGFSFLAYLPCKLQGHSEGEKVGNYKAYGGKGYSNVQINAKYAEQ